MIEIQVPTLGESVTEATVGRWLKQAGEAVASGEVLVELETDKVAVEVPAPSAGVLAEILAPEGETLEVGGLLARLDESRKAAPAPKAAAKAEAKVEVAAEAAAPPAAEPRPAPAAPVETPAQALPLSPAVRKLVAEHSLDPARIPASGRDGRLLKEDVLAFLEQTPPAPAAPRRTEAPAPQRAPGARPQAAREEVVRMTRLRQRIAERLKEAQQTAAILTTFNEADMTAIQAARAAYRDVFEKKHGVRLGFMSFFVRACVLALKELPAVNAEIEGDSLIYKNYYNIGVAVGTPQGLVVPVLKDADRMGFAEVESAIADFGRRARDGKLSIDEMQGGTFTISNGGVYGSLLSTPILNPPQAAILGMHKIQQRPMAVDGKIEIRPMMYLALSYDHRIIDGREAVSFLVRVKELLEAPDRLLFDV